METFSAWLALCAVNSPVPGEFPAQRPVTRSFDVFFDLHPNKRLSKQWWGWWFETLSSPLWRHCNDLCSYLCWGLQTAEVWISNHMTRFYISKAFDSLPHGLLIAKLSAYWVHFNSCKLLASYLYNRHQRVKLGDVRSEWGTLPKSVPQDSILGPLSINVFMNDIFFLDCDCHIYDYADDNCISYFSDIIDDTRKFLTNDIIVFMNWFKQNSLKANPEKFRSMLTSSYRWDVDNKCWKYNHIFHGKNENTRCEDWRQIEFHRTYFRCVHKGLSATEYSSTS